MRTFYFLGFLVLFLNINTVVGQQMSPDKLQEIIGQVSDTMMASGNSIHFLYKERPLICVFDATANRMRIISPIIERKQLGEEALLNALVANFHSALDVKYALSDEIIWSVFIHPLKELTRHQVVDAIKQVYASSSTFGTTYSSTHLVFPGNSKKDESPYQKKLIEKF